MSAILAPLQLALLFVTTTGKRFTILQMVGLTPFRSP